MRCWLDFVTAIGSIFSTKCFWIKSSFYRLEHSCRLKMSCILTRFFMKTFFTVEIKLSEPPWKWLRANSESVSLQFVLYLLLDFPLCPAYWRPFLRTELYSIYHHYCGIAGWSFAYSASAHLLHWSSQKSCPVKGRVSNWLFTLLYLKAWVLGL